MAKFLTQWLLVLMALLFTISASGSMAMVAMNTWGVQCPRPIAGLLWQGLIASVLWAIALSANDN